MISSPCATISTPRICSLVSPVSAAVSGKFRRFVRYRCFATNSALNGREPRVTALNPSQKRAARRASLRGRSDFPQRLRSGVLATGWLRSLNVQKRRREGLVCSGICSAFALVIIPAVTPARADDVRRTVASCKTGSTMVEINGARTAAPRPPKYNFTRQPLFGKIFDATGSKNH
jgi:hypothetical protein